MPRILVVEDDGDLRQALVYNLGRAGHELLVAHRGDLALRLAREQRPDVVVLALMLPDVSGLELCRTLKRDPVLARVPVIMLTDDGDELHRVGFELGADHYLAKPFSVRELGLRIQAVLRRGPPTAS